MTHDLHNIQLKIASGDESMLAELYQLFYKRLKQFARLITRNDETAEEVVDDVFVKLWSARNKITGIENLTVYLYVAVKNAALNDLSRRAKELVDGSFDYLDIELKDADNPHELMVTAEIMRRMQDAIDALPPRCKMIFKL